MAGHKEVTHHFQHPFHPFLPESVALHYFCNHVAQPRAVQLHFCFQNEKLLLQYTATANLEKKLQSVTIFMKLLVCL